MIWWKFLFLNFVALSCEATYIKKRERFFAQSSMLRWFFDKLMGEFPDEFPYQCNQIGQYPDPYDCRSYFTCDNITDTFNTIKDKETGMPIFEFDSNFKDTEDFCYPERSYIFSKGIFPTKYCTCPNGTYWGGPAAGCIEKDSEDMKACCSFKPYCCNYKGEGGDFKSCSLSALGYKYACVTREVIKSKLLLQKSQRPGPHKSSGKRSSDKISNLDDLNAKTDKVLPICTLIRHVVNYYPAFHGRKICTITFNKTSLSEPLSIVDDFKLQDWSIYDNQLAMSRIRVQVDPSFTKTTELTAHKLDNPPYLSILLRPE